MKVLPTIIRLIGHGPVNRGKFRLALWAYQTLRPLKSPQVANLVNGMRMEVDPNEFVQSQIYYIGAYELYLARFLLKLVQPGSVFLDVGAHVGQYTLIAAGAGATVHAFEPNPVNFVRLQRNVALNALSDVTLNGCAVGAQPGERPFVLPSPDNTGAGSLSRSALGKEIRVQVIALSDYCATHSIRPSVIKMDIEGAELDALQGGERVIREARPVLILEVFNKALAGFGHSSDELIQFLDRYQYNINTLMRDRLKPLAARGAVSDYDNLICFPPEHHPPGRLH